MPQQVIEWIGNHLGTVIVLGSIFIQITPIKINPWTTIFQWIGKTITDNACSKIDGIIVKITNLENEMKGNEKDRIRWEILSFANSCRSGHKHTKDEFDHIIRLHDKYEILVKETNDPNEVFTMEYNYVKEIYKKRLLKNDFLVAEGGE